MKANMYLFAYKGQVQVLADNSEEAVDAMLDRLAEDGANPDSWEIIDVQPFTPTKE